MKSNQVYSCHYMLNGHYLNYLNDFYSNIYQLRLSQLCVFNSGTKSCTLRADAAVSGYTYTFVDQCLATTCEEECLYVPLFIRSEG